VEPDHLWLLALLLYPFETSLKVGSSASNYMQYTNCQNAFNKQSQYCCQAWVDDPTAWEQEANLEPDRSLFVA
jgi:hypothetical protein